MSPFDKIVAAVRRSEFYVPRDYKTVGGIWTVDTYLRDGVTVQIMDEGWTTRVFSEEFDVTVSGTTTPKFLIGDEQVLETIAKRFT